ncbi:NAD(P)H-binding protein [Dietzia lutea]|uniref:NmrA family transcriptional regulator n=1 Tax=Dietzia lutea TaxID=546160 RepID=A0A2S1R9G7_9ACTN|nr:NAD(P)H-binding protein [Dietzia lutea]AWH92894.1 NmrA family transcriptional regulator [Dietzia lutea]
MEIAVTTPQGNVGRHLTRMLIRAGVRPVLLTRHPDRIPADVAEHAEPRQADSRDPGQVIAATADVDALYWVDPPAESPDPLTDYRRATESIVAAIEANWIGRVVFQSSVGAEKRHGAGEIDGLADTEVALDQSNAAVTHLRCDYFFTNLLFEVESLRAGRLQTVLPLDAPMSWVAPRDIAEVVALTLLDTGWHGRRVQGVHGPEDLSWAQVARIVTEELGREVRVERITDEQMRERHLGAGMPPAWADALLGMSTGLRDDFVPEQARSIVTTTPTRLRSWVREELAPLV